MFFSNNRVFAYLILLASFANPYAGLSGLIAVLMGIGFAWWLGFDKNLIKAGTYSFNCLTIGLVMGLYFNYNIPFFVFLAVCCLGQLLFLLLEKLSELELKCKRNSL